MIIIILTILLMVVLFHNFILHQRVEEYKGYYNTWKQLAINSQDIPPNNTTAYVSVSWGSGEDTRNWLGHTWTNGESKNIELPEDFEESYADNIFTPTYYIDENYQYVTTSDGLVVSWRYSGHIKYCDCGKCDGYMHT